MTTRFVRGDCRAVLARLPADSVHCCITSPPYWGLRDYGIPPTVWGGDAKCKHVWSETVVEGRKATGNNYASSGLNGAEAAGYRARLETRVEASSRHATCCRCGAWRGAHGLEPTIDLYVRNAVEIFRAVHRVLRPDGTLWLNLGDSYATGTGKERKPTQCGKHGYWENPNVTHRINGAESNLKPKDLCGIPWRIAFALQADGWWLRSEIIWAKPNPMPESVTDRPTKSHEQIFLLTKSARYYFDAEAIKEPASEQTHPRVASKPQLSAVPGMGPHTGLHKNGRLPGVTPKSAPEGSKVRAKESWHASTTAVLEKRNKRSVWTVATSPFPEAHFATFPPTLIEPCIKAGTSEKGCCAKCGAPWERQTKQVGGKSGKSWHDHEDDLARGQRGGASGYHGTDRKEYESYSKETLGWQPTCKCAAAVVPCTVLDPFAGAGTTGLVADRLQRDAVLIELGAKYVAMSRRRIANDRKPKVKARRSVRRPAPPQLCIAACRR